MVAVGMDIALVIFLLILILGLLLEARFSTRDHLEGYDDALDEMRNSLNVVAQVMNRLPEMIPSFSINENPLSQILQFFQQRSEQAQQQQQGSLDTEQLRDDNGKFSDGSKKQE